MKRIILIIIVLILPSIYAQQSSSVNNKQLKNWLLSEYNEYAKESLNDTIYAKRFPIFFDLEFVYKYILGTSILHYFDKNGHKVITSDFKLIQQGYKRQYIKWLNEEDHTLGVIWVYVRQPTLSGFMKWLENKKK